MFRRVSGLKQKRSFKMKAKKLFAGIMAITMLGAGFTGCGTYRRFFFEEQNRTLNLPQMKTVG